MRKVVYLFALALLVLLSACSRDQMLPPRTVEVEGSYSISIPANFKPCNDLHDFATLQYADEREGYFLIGIEEPKSSMENLKVEYSLADYSDFVETTVGGVYDSMLVTARDTLMVNGIRCQTADLLTYIQSDEAPLEVYYRLAVFESENRFYQLIGWTQADQRPTLMAASQAIEQSFQECSDSKVESQTASAAKLR